MLDNLTVGMGKDLRPNQYYNLIDPETQITYKANPNRVWSYIPESMAEKIKQKRIVFPKNGTGRPMLKRYLKDLKTDINPFSSLLTNDDLNIGLNSEGTKIIQNIFGTKLFDYPKPVSLIELLVSQITSSGDIILDSFAGSGTTAHAVLNLNKQDGGNRKFILIEMEDYAETITAERVKRVMTGYADKEATGGSFDYYNLGEALFTEDGVLNESVTIDKIRKYIFYTETQSALQEQTHSDNPYFLGLFNNTAYYFYYQAGAGTTLNHQFLSTIQTKAEQYIIYADNCVLTKDYLTKHTISFKKIPRDITQF
jgi:adenine-specific DNA-methyltransferase